MWSAARRSSVGILLAAILAVRAAEPVARPAGPDPRVAYDAYVRHGFHVWVSKRLADEGESLRRLDHRLEQIGNVVPPGHLSILSQVAVWLEPTSGGRLPATLLDSAAAFYVPLDTAMDPGLFGLRPEMRGGAVVFADRLLYGPDGRRRGASAPGWLLHEMAHALHDRVLGYDDAAVKAAYDRAVERRLYDSVPTRILGDDGKLSTELRQAYARTNPFEYFAELSVAYLEVPDWSYPFTRDDLADHDPGGYAVMDGFWRPVKYRVVNDFAFPVSVERLAQSGRRFRALDLMPGKEKPLDGWEGMSVVATDMLDGSEYRMVAPARDNKIWRLSAATCRNPASKKFE